MQKPASSFFSKEGATRSMKNGTHTRTDKTDNTQNGDNIEQVVARSTPVKRKCNLWMDLGNTSDLSTTESPAKRRRENFNCLLKYWDGGGGGALDLKDEALKPISNLNKKDNLEISGNNAQIWKTTEPKSNPGGGGGRE